MRTLPGFIHTRWDDAPDVVEHAVSVAPKEEDVEEGVDSPAAAQSLGDARRRQHAADHGPNMVATCLQLHEVAAGRLVYSCNSVSYVGHCIHKAQH